MNFIIQVTLFKKPLYVGDSNLDASVTLSDPFTFDKSAAQIYDDAKYVSAENFEAQVESRLKTFKVHALMLEAKLRGEKANLETIKSTPIDQVVKVIFL